MNTARSPRQLKLHDWHRKAGAEFYDDRGFLVPAAYGGSGVADVKAGLIDLSHYGRLELVGADRLRFLGGLVTSAVADLEVGQGTYGFVTSLKGKVLADVVVSAFEDRLFLLLPPGRSKTVHEHLSKYIVADRVEVLPLQDLLPIALVGEDGEGRLPEGAWPQQPWGCGMVELFGTQLPVSRHERLGVSALIAWVSSSIVGPVVEELVERLELSLVGAGELVQRRVHLGLPAFGIDFDENNLAQESGIDAIDFTKGCYLGQEVIARLHYRGQAPKIVRRLILATDGVHAGDEGVRAGDEVWFEDRAAGTVTSVADGACLAMVQRRAAEPGSEVTIRPSGQEDLGSRQPVEARIEAL